MSESASGSAHATYERTSGNGPLGSHPMRQQVIDAILKGEPATSIKKWVSPKVSHVSICKLAHIVKQQMQVATVLKQAETLANVTQLTTVKESDAPRLTRDALMGQQHLARIQQHQARIDAALAGAESASDISTLVKTDLAGIRLAAELDGSLAQAIGPQVVNNTQVIVLPQFASEEIEPAIDVQSEPV